MMLRIIHTVGASTYPIGVERRPIKGMTKNTHSESVKVKVVFGRTEYIVGLCTEIYAALESNCCEKKQETSAPLPETLQRYSVGCVEFLTGGGCISAGKKHTR